MFFEMVMLICFGVAWPLSIYKTATSSSCEGKSLLFLATILMGYASGLIYKFYFNYDHVVYLYLLNTIMVLLDFVLTFIKKRATDSSKEFIENFA